MRYLYRFELNIEPMFAVMALYDAKEKKKISESFHLDCNSSDLQHMLDDHWDERSMASLSRSAIFNITYPSSDVYLIIRVPANFSQLYSLVYRVTIHYRLRRSYSRVMWVMLWSHTSRQKILTRKPWKNTK